MGEVGGLNLYAFCLNSPVVFVDTNGYWPWTSYWEDLKATVISAATEVSNQLDGALKDVGEMVVNEVLSPMHELAKAAAHNQKARGRFEKRYKKSGTLYDINFGWFIEATDEPGRCCASVQLGGRAGGTLKLKMLPIPYIGGFPAITLAGSLRGGYRWCVGDPETPNRGNLVGSFGVSLAGGIRWEKAISAWGATGKAMAEVGVYGGWKYVFEELKGYWSGGVYARGLLEVNTGDWWGWQVTRRYEFRWNTGTGGGGFD